MQAATTGASPRNRPNAATTAMHDDGPKPPKPTSPKPVVRTGSKDAKTTRNKSQDPPFVLTYLAVVLIVYLVKGDEFKEFFPDNMFDTEFPRPSSTQLTFVGTALALGVPFLVAWRRLIKYVLVDWFATNWAGLQPGSPKHEKFLEQGWLFFHYAVTVIVEYVALREKPWWPPVINHDATLALAADRPERLADQADPLLSFSYGWQLAFYATELLTLLATPRAKLRSDWGVYLYHHLVTCSLLGYSYLTQNQRIGSLVLFVHDLADVFLPIAKCFSYAEAHLRKTRSKSVFLAYQTVGTSLFVVFIVTFIIPRIFFFGGLIYQGVTTNRWYLWCHARLPDGSVSTYPCPASGGGALAVCPLLMLLMALWPIHVWWSMLIVRMAANVVFASEYQDVRSDDD